MPKISVKYSKEVTEIIDWPEDEMGLFSYENLEANLGDGNTVKEEIEYNSITSVKVDGEEHQF